MRTSANVDIGRVLDGFDGQLIGYAIPDIIRACRTPWLHDAELRLHNEVLRGGSAPISRPRPRPRHRVRSRTDDA